MRPTSTIFGDGVQRRPRGPEARDGDGNVVEPVARAILDRETRDARFGGALHIGGDVGRVVGETGLVAGVDRKVGRRDEAA